MLSITRNIIPFSTYQGCFRWPWCEISFTPKVGLALEYSIDAFGGREEGEGGLLHINLVWPNIFIKLPVFFRQYKRADDHPWFGIFGFSWAFRSSWHIHWKGKCHIVDLPYDWTHVRTTLLNPDGGFCADLTDWSAYPFEQLKALESSVSEIHSYQYILRSGKMQQRTAFIHGKEMEWRWRWLKSLPFPRKISRTIDIEFDAEVGERTGSWKGGCIGCSTEWKRGETMLDALRRMERTRKF